MSLEGRRHAAGPRGLLVDMLALAVRQVVDPDRGGWRGDGGRLENQQDARRWLLKLDPDPVISVQAACDAAGIEYEALREFLLHAGVLRWKPRPAPSRRGRPRST